MNKLYILLACFVMFGSVFAGGISLGNISTNKTRLGAYSYLTTLKNGTALAVDTVKNSISASNLLLDCDILTCDYKVEITAKQALTFDETTLKGKYSGAGTSVQKIFYQDTKQEERTRPIYGTEKQEQCTIDNKTSIKTCENVTVQVEKGTETYYETVGFENTAITTPFAKDEKRTYVIRFAKDSPSRNVDIYHEIYGQERKDAAWWNMTYNYKKQINITNWNCTAAYCQFPIYVGLNSSTTNGSDIRVLNSSETGEWGFWREDGWNYTNASGNLWVNASNQTSMIYVYYNASGAADKNSVDATFLFGDDFNGASINTSKWTSTLGGGYINLSGAGDLIMENNSASKSAVFQAINASTDKFKTILKITSMTGTINFHFNRYAPGASDNYDYQGAYYFDGSGINRQLTTYGVNGTGSLAASVVDKTALNLPETWTVYSYGSPSMLYNATFALNNGSFIFNQTYLPTYKSTVYHAIYLTQLGTNARLRFNYIIEMPLNLSTPSFTIGAQESAPGTTGTLTVNYTTGGTAIGSNSTFTPPANLTINATASVGYSFINWTENCNGTVNNATNPNTYITVNDNVTCFAQANFAENAPIIQTSTITPTVAYQYNSLLGYCNATTGATTVTYNYTWYLNGAANASGSVGPFTQGVNTNVANISSASIAVGQIWILQCMAYNANGASAFLNSSAKTIMNTTPSITAISISPASPTIASNLTCIITVTDNEHATTNITGNWSKNGAVLLAFTYNNLANNTATTAATLNSGNFSKNDNVSCTARAFDGVYYSAAATSANKTILNSAPTNPTVNTFVNATVGHWFTVNGSVTDADGGSDIATVTITPSLGTCVQMSNSTSGTSFSVKYNCTSTSPGTATVHIGFTDASAAYANNSSTNAYPDHNSSMTAPTITPTTISNASIATCNMGVFSDIDGDTENVSARTYAWQYNGVAAGITTATFDLAAYGANNSDNVSCSITATNSTWATSNATAMSENATLVVFNGYITASASLSPAAPTPEQNVSCVLSVGVDDYVNITYGWYRNLVLISSGSLDNVTNGTLNLTTLANSSYTYGDMIICQAVLTSETYSTTVSATGMVTGTANTWNIKPLPALFIDFWQTWGSMLAAFFSLGISYMMNRTISGTLLSASVLSFAVFLFSVNLSLGGGILMPLAIVYFIAGIVAKIGGM